jgi:hypothetical protein
MAEADKTCWIYCNSCQQSTRHVLVAPKEYHHDSPDDNVGWWGEYRLWSCAGCDTCVMEHRYTASYMVSYTADGENQIYENIYHPKRESSSRPIKHFVNLPEKLNTLYSEVVKSNNEELHLLCAVGLRSLLEGVCADKGIEGTNLEKKIEEMKSFLPESIVKNLHEFRFMGNRAVHELEAPNNFELSTALDVIEDILNFFYALDYKASLLGKIRAARREGAQGNPATAAAPTKRTAALPGDSGRW